MSLTTEAFGFPRGSRNRHWIYYTITNAQVLQNALRDHPDKLMVLMLWAPWNEPSKVMKTPFWSIARSNKQQAVFCMADVDNVKSLAEQYGAEALPTFVLIKNSTVQAKVVGAKEEELKNSITQYRTT